MLVISDNSALSALAEIRLIDQLPTLFGEISITRSVFDEGTCVGAPDALIAFLRDSPEWLSILDDPEEFLEETESLGAGEASSITLAWKYREQCLLILDERRGRNIASGLGLKIAGVVAIIGQLAVRGSVDFDATIDALRATGFRVSAAVIEEVRQRLDPT